MKKTEFAIRYFLNKNFVFFKVEKCEVKNACLCFQIRIHFLLRLLFNGAYYLLLIFGARGWEDHLIDVIIELQMKIENDLKRQAKYFNLRVISLSKSQGFIFPKKRLIASM
jgi:hypothetical protein